MVSLTIERNFYFKGKVIQNISYFVIKIITIGILVLLIWFCSNVINGCSSIITVASLFLFMSVSIIVLNCCLINNSSYVTAIYIIF
jgi:hypothetical protein